MNCKNCGTQLTGMEQNCPVCGTPVVQGAVQPPTTMPQVEVQQFSGMNAYPNQVQPEAVLLNPEGNSIPPKEKKNNKKTVAVALALIAVIAIGAGVFLSLREEPTPQQKEEIPQKEEGEDVVSNQIQYAGYQFTLSPEYDSTIVSDTGLIIKNSDVMFTIAVDYTSPYSYYKQEFLRVYPDTSFVMMANDKEYVTSLAGVTDGFGTEYMTVASDEDSSTFVGLIIHSDYTQATERDLDVLNEILISATKEYDVTVGSSEDIGRAGIINYVPVFAKENFVF